MKNKFISFIAIGALLALIAACASEKDMHDGMASASKKGGMMKGEAAMGSFQLEAGKVVNVDMGKTILIKNDMGEVALNLEKAAPVIDAMAGMSTKMTSIKKDDQVYAWVSPAYTASMPPQTAAEVVFINVKNMEEIPTLVEIASVASEKDGYAVTAADGSKWMLAQATEIAMCASTGTPGKTDAKALKKGVKALFWKSGMMKDDMMMKSDMKMKDDMMTESSRVLIIKK